MRALLALAVASVVAFPAVAATWTQFTLEPSIWSVEFPGEPVLTTNADAGPRDLEAVVTMGDAYFVLDVRFLAAGTVDTAGGADAYLMNRRNSAVGKGKLLSDKGVTLNGYPERDFVFDRGTGYASMRAILVGNRLYQVLFAAKNAEAVGGADAMHFLNSFKLHLN